MKTLISKKADLNNRAWGEGAGYCSDVYFYRADEPESYYLRLGTATIEKEESKFTKYPGYIRYHRVIKGDVKLELDDGSDFINNDRGLYVVDGSKNITCLLNGEPAEAVNVIHHYDFEVSDSFIVLGCDDEASFPARANVGSNKKSHKNTVIEMLYLIEGEVEIKHGTGRKEYLSSGDTLIIESTKEGDDEHDSIVFKSLSVESRINRIVAFVKN